MGAIRFPGPRFIGTNGLRMAIYEEGEGIPVVLCHGFPEIAYSWRHQLPALAEAGFRAIAPDQRGYGRTDRPEPVESYNIRELSADLVGLLDALAIDRAVFCGHDWGGIVVWALPLLHPDRVAGVIGVNTPFFRRPPIPTIEALRNLFGEDHYIVYFQKPGEADRALAKNVRRTFQFLFRKGIPAAEMEARRRERGGTMNFVSSLEQTDLPGEQLLSEEELSVFVKTFEETGFTGGINWYRNMDWNWRFTQGLEERIPVPSLMVCAEDDPALPPQLADGMDKYVPDLEKHLIRACGHWTQQERPEELNRILVDWLRRRFPPA